MHPPSGAHLPGRRLPALALSGTDAAAHDLAALPGRAGLYAAKLRLSDPDLTFGRALALPTFGADGQTLLRRLTLMVHDGHIEHVFYPVFPPDRNAGDVLAWLGGHPL